MVDNNSCLKYKYLMFKVSREENGKDAMYKYSYTITGIGSYNDTNVLGYYDAKKTCSVVLMSNKDIFEYDWTTIPSRIRSGDQKNYLDMFKVTTNIIIVTDQVNPLPDIDKNYGFKLSNAFPGYTLQFINPVHLEMVENENLIEKPESTEEKKRAKQEEKRDKEWKKRLTEIPEESRPKIVFVDEIEAAKIEVKPKFSFSSLMERRIMPWFAIICLIFLVVFMGFKIPEIYERFSNWIDEKVNAPQEVVKEVKTETTVKKNTYTAALNWSINSDSVFTSVDSASVFNTEDAKARADSIYLASLASRADSIAKEIQEKEKVIAELPKEKKVQIELMATIEDGITTRRVQTGVILDTIKEADMKHLTKVITSMATNMAKDRQTEIDTSKTYYKTVRINSETPLTWNN